MIQAMLQTDLLQRCACAFGRPVQARQFGRQHHVLQCREAGQQLKRLEHEADAAGAHRGACVLVHGTDVMAGQFDPARTRQVQSRQQ